MNLHVEMEKWEEAFLLGKQNRELLELAKIPYANWLVFSAKLQLPRKQQISRIFSNDHA